MNNSGLLESEEKALPSGDATQPGSEESPESPLPPSPESGGFPWSCRGVCFGKEKESVEGYGRVSLSLQRARSTSSCDPCLQTDEAQEGNQEQPTWILPTADCA